MPLPLLAAQGAWAVGRPLLMAAGRFVVSNAARLAPQALQVAKAAAPGVINAAKTAAPGLANAAKVAAPGVLNAVNAAKAAAPGVINVAKNAAPGVAQLLSKVDKAPAFGPLAKGLALVTAAGVATSISNSSNKDVEVKTKEPPSMNFAQKAVAFYHFCKILGAGWEFAKDPKAFLADKEQSSSAVHHIAACMSLRSGNGIIMSELGGMVASSLTKSLVGAINNNQYNKALMFGGLGTAAAGLNAASNFNTEGVSNVVGQTFNKAKGLDMRDVFVGRLAASGFAYIASELGKRFEPGMMSQKAAADILENKAPHMAEASRQNYANQQNRQNESSAPEQAAEKNAAIQKQATAEAAPAM